MIKESNQILVDSYRAGVIDKIAKDNTTIFTDFDDFVNEAIGTYIIFWTDPAQAQVNFNKRNDNYPQLTDHYFTGDYPVKIIDELGEDKVTQLSLLSTGSNN